ncbi:MAG: hypothetical protein RLZZ168_1013, partial [Cyanobacteriota bacterium]
FTMVTAAPPKRTVLSVSRLKTLASSI